VHAQTRYGCTKFGAILHHSHLQHTPPRVSLFTTELGNIIIALFLGAATVHFFSFAARAPRTSC
jgi:hypothetical protein